MLCLTSLSVKTIDSIKFVNIYKISLSVFSDSVIQIIVLGITCFTVLLYFL